MARRSTAKPLTDEQRALAAETIRLVNRFVFCNPFPWLNRADFRSEMFLAVVRGASHFDPAKGSFDTWIHRFMERRYRSMRDAVYRRSTFAWKGQRRQRKVKVVYVDPQKLARIPCAKRDGRFVGDDGPDARRPSQHHLRREH